MAALSDLKDHIIRRSDLGLVLFLAYLCILHLSTSIFLCAYHIIKASVEQGERAHDVGYSLLGPRVGGMDELFVSGEQYDFHAKPQNRWSRYYLPQQKLNYLRCNHWDSR